MTQKCYIPLLTITKSNYAKNNCMATYFPSHKPTNLNEPNLLDTVEHNIQRHTSLSVIKSFM